LLPYYKIECYNPAGTLIHTLTSDVLSIHTHSVLNDVGSFNFSVPALKGSSYPYNNIVGNWKVQIWLGYNDLAGSTHVLTGKIKKTTGPLNIGEGYVRSFEGKDLTEILERRQKTNKNYQVTDADVIAAELAADLGLTLDYDAESTHETVLVRTETYLDLIKKISDYWYNAGTQIKRDFYIEPDGHLQWRSRPSRATGLSSLTIGENILSYTVTRDILAVKNNITVYGAAQQPYPTDKDAFTEALSGTGWVWAAAAGDTVDLDAVAPKVGSNSIRGYTGAASHEVELTLTLPYSLTIRDITELRLWEICSNLANSSTIKILAPDASNYFEYTNTVDGNWHFRELSLGPTNEYDAASNPNGIWIPQGTPNWWNMTGIVFYYHSTTNNDWYCHIDGLYFMPTRYSHTESDAASIAAYEQCDAEYTDENLLSNEACEVRAQTLLYQLKDEIVRVDITVIGDTNLRIGDRIPITIPAENIAAQNFDVITVNHDFSSSGFTSTISAVNSGNTRKLPPLGITDSIGRQIKNLREVTCDLYRRVVR
jgi:hypothetical protein